MDPLTAGVLGPQQGGLSISGPSGEAVPHGSTGFMERMVSGENGFFVTRQASLPGRR